MNSPGEDTAELRGVLPSTVAYIGYHAARRPDDVAVIENGREISYNQFYQDIGRMVPVLRRFGLGSGDVVGVEYPRFYLHWLTVLAIEALGAASFSYEKSDAGNLTDALAAADFVLCSPGRAPSSARRTQIMDRDWIASVRSLAPECPVETAPIGPGTPLRIVKSSGTTGSTKRMIHTGRVREFWIGQYLFRTGFNRRSRYLIPMGFSVEAFHAYVTACIRMGGVCVSDDRTSIAAALTGHAITHVTLPPFVLMQVLDNMPENYTKAANLTIFTIGAPVSKAVRARVERELAEALIESYGTQEIAAICTMDENGVGAVMPDVRVEVVDDDGQPILNAPGRVRVLTDGAVAGYIDDPEATRRMFRDGWFYPGDLAVMEEKRFLRLMGRADDVLNIQGLKFGPGPLEENLLANLPVDDLCLTAIADSEGVSRLWIVVVLRDPDGLPSIQEQLLPLIPATYGKVKFVALREVPRTVTGKVRRKELNQMLREIQTKKQNE